MSSIITNTSAMNALTTLRSVNNGLAQTQERISTGLKVNSAKDNAAYFSISETMKGDSGMYASIDEGLTLTKNSLTVARKGAEEFVKLANTFVQKVAFGQSDSMDHASIQAELTELAKQMTTVIEQSTFNGESWVNSDDTVDVVTGVSRDGGAFDVTTHALNKVDFTAIQTVLAGIDLTDTTTTRSAKLVAVEAQLKLATEGATTLGLNEKTIETQQEFLKSVVGSLDTGVGAMIDADMEEEAARLQALQVQQQLATQALSIANQGPQNLLSLFR